MKKSKLFAKVTAVALATLTMFSSMTVAFAEDSTVTDKANIVMHYENEVGVKKMSDEDGKIFAEAMGYDTFDGGKVHICSEETSFDIDWEKSAIPMDDVFVVDIIAPNFLRDDAGKLVVSSTNIFPNNSMTWWGNGHFENDWIGEMLVSYFDITGKRPETLSTDCEWINDNLCRIYKENCDFITEEIEISDIYIIRVYYTIDGLGNYFASDTPWSERECRYSDFFVLPEGVDTVLNLEDIEEDTSKDDETVDNYVVDFTAGNAVVSSSDFSAILTENATKDVIIKSNNNVTFTFARGTMKAVDGMTNYDFTTTINNTYKSDLPSYVTKDNFVSLVDYNYSGKLPAEASIKIPVGTEYAGKTLYYSLMNEDKTFAEVQVVIVDAEGYITVKQDHCSSYVITNTEPKLDTNTEQPTTNNNTEQPTTNNNTEQPTTNNNTEQPTTNNNTEQPTTNNSTEQPTTNNDTEQPTTNNNTEQPTTNNNTEQPTTDNNTEQPTTDNNTEQPTTNNSTEQPTPDTRDNTTILLFIGVGMVAIVAVVVARKFKTA